MDFNLRNFISKTLRKFLLNQNSKTQNTMAKITITESIQNLLTENVATAIVQAEVEKIIRDAVPKIKDMIEKYNNCKIGKSGNIENRFDKSYTDQGYIELIPISSCAYKEAMDLVEIYLIKYFKDYIDNKADSEVGNKTYSGDYWIYIVHKGVKPSVEEKTK